MGKNITLVLRSLINIMAKKKVVEKAEVKRLPVKSKSVVRRVAITKKAGAKPFPQFEGKTVLGILANGHTKTHYHCRMSGGVTMHVPKSLF